jgi:hypothetical protein
MVTTVVNMHKDYNYDVDITRNGIYGNPFIIGRDGDRKQVLSKFRRWLKGTDFRNLDQQRRKLILDSLPSLKDRKLGCVCVPESCHGHIYIDFIEGLEDVEVA